MYHSYTISYEKSVTIQLTDDEQAELEGIEDFEDRKAFLAKRIHASWNIEPKDITGYDTEDTIRERPEFIEYCRLLKGESISDDWRGLKYRAKINWEEDRFFHLEIESVTTMPGSDMRFWWGKDLTGYDPDLLRDLISNSPEARKFQERINDYCDNTPDDLHEAIMDVAARDGII